jgi:chromosome segregation ATPase
MSDTQAITGTMQVVVTDEQLAQFAPLGTTSTKVDTPAPAPAINDAQMRAAAEALTHGARMYHGMLDAAAALNQVGSLGAAINERQGVLNGLDSSINERKARLAALDSTVATQVANNERAMNEALRAASDKLAEAQAQAATIVKAAQDNATALNLSAREKAGELLDQANSTASQIQLQSAAEAQKVKDLEAKAAQLEGQVNDLETHIAVAKASLRQLIGD